MRSGTTMSWARIVAVAALGEAARPVDATSASSAGVPMSMSRTVAVVDAATRLDVPAPASYALTATLVHGGGAKLLSRCSYPNRPEFDRGLFLRH
jgi:hypothetical protein